MKKSLKFLSLFLTVVLFVGIFSAAMPVFAAEVQTVSEETELNSEETTENDVDDGENDDVDEEYVEEPLVVLSEDESKREQYVKHFAMSDGTFKAAQYNTPVHFLDENGNWVDYDNTLSETDCETERSVFAKDFVNTQSDVEIRLSKKTNGSKLVRMKTEDFSVSWNFEDIEKVTGKVTEKTDDADPITLENLNSEVIYEDVFENVDLQYILTSGFLKENVILKDKNVITEYYINYKNPDLTAKLVDDKTIELCDKNGDAVFVINAPYMQDSEGQTSDGITLSITESKNGQFTMKMTLDEEWLNSEGVVYPVTVDPIMKTGQAWSDPAKSQSVFVASGYDWKNYSSEGSIYVGYENDSNESLDDESSNIMRGSVRGYLKCDLPELKNGDKVVKAEVAMYLDKSYTTRDNYIGVYRVTLKDWQRNTITWATQPYSDTDTEYYDNMVVDYQKMPYEENTGFWMRWEITDLARGWYSGEDNYGILFRATDESYGAGRAWFMASGYPLEGERPALEITYRNMSGYEDYYSYTSIAAGRDGTASVNNYNGNFVFTQYLTESCGGEIMPVNISMVYNSNKSDSNYANMGNGVQTNYHLFVKENTRTETGQDKFKYYLTDADGTDHYFYFANTTDSTGYDEDGLGYELWVNPQSNTPADENERFHWVKYRITDKDKNTMEFNRYGWLIRIKSSTNKEIYIQHELGTDNATPRIKLIGDGVGREYIFAYNEQNNISSITAPANRITRFDYTTYHLTNITFPDEKTISFHQSYHGHCWDNIYSPDRHVAVVYDLDGYQKPVTAIGGYSYSGKELDYYDFAYNQNETLVKNQLRHEYVYQFNDYGQTTGIVANHGGQAQHFEYVPGNNTSGKANSVVSSSKVQSSTVNLVTNPSFDNDSYSYEIDNTTDAYGMGHDNNIGNFGVGSLYVQKLSTPGLATAVQKFVNLPSGKYTLSAYAHTDAEDFSGQGMVRLKASNSNNETYSTVPVYKTTGWERFSVTVEISEVSNLELFIGLDDGSKGKIWFDDVQLESGSGATAFNLVENSGFKNGLNYWTANDNTFGSEPTNKVYGQSHTGKTNGYLLSGTKYIYQQIKVNGKKGDVFSVGGWGAAASVPLEEKTFGSQTVTPRFGFLVEFYDANGNLIASEKPFNCNFNPDVKSWQFKSMMAIAPGDYASVNIYLEYNNNANYFYFTGIYCNKENYGQTYVYDDNGNIVSSQDLAKTESSFAYSNNQMTKLLNPSGSRYLYSYDEQNKLNYALSSDGQEYGFQYDANGNVTDTYISPLKPATVIVPNKNYFIVNAGTGKAIDSGEASSGADEVTCQSYTPYYDSQKWLVASTDESNVFQMASVRRTPGTPSSSNANNYFFKVSGESNTNGSVVMTNNSYYSTDNQYFKAVKNDDGTFTLYMKKSGYDAGVNGVYKCLNCEETEAVGSTPKNTVYETVCKPGELKETMKWYFYEVPTGTEKHLSTHAAYTDNGNLTTSVTDVNGSTMLYGYNNINNGLVTQKVAPNGAISYYDYNYSNNQLSSVYSCGAASSYSYDSVGRLSQIKSTTDTGVDELNYNFIYDDCGRLQTISVGDQPLITTEYDAFGRPATKSYGNGQKISTFYDDLDRLYLVWYNMDLNKAVFYLYANDGNLSFVLDRFSNTKTQYTYDLSGRVVDVRVYGGASLNDYSTLKNWVKYYYADKTNYLIGMTQWTPEIGTQKYEYIYGDVSQGQMPDQVYTVKLNDQVVQSYTFDQLGRQTAKTVPLANETLGHYYSYKHLYDNRSSTQVESFENRLGRYSYTYDNNGNITNEVFAPWSENLQGYTKYYEYDALNQLTRCIDGLGNHWYYQYDKAGNIVYEECIDSQNVYTIKHYSYGNSNWRDQLTSYNGEDIYYDNIGNPTVYRGANLTWSEGRRLASYSKNGNTVNFKYDCDGKRIKKTVNSNVYNYIYNQGTLVGICENDSLLLEFIVDEKGDYIGLYFDGIPYYYVRNVQGDVVAISDQWGNNIVGYTYDPWGKVLSVYGQEAWFGYINPIRYRGYFYDEETSLYYLQSRYYDPESNRFINADDIGVVTASPDSANYDKNLYAYCDNNPVIRTDEGGAFWDTVFDVVSLAISVVEVVKSPKSVKAWASLAVDAVCLIVPGVTGGGAIVKAASKLLNKADDVVDAGKAIDNAVDAGKAVGNFTDTTKSVKKIHGNSLKSPKTNYGYVLVDKDNNILKFGESINPSRRYTKKYLSQNQYTVKVLESGSKIDIHYWQYDMNMYYKSKYGVLPPLNKRGW